jgi:hypothetical protein
MYLLAALVALVGAGLAAGPAYELQVAALTALVLVVASRRHERARVAVLIAIAMAGEVLGSLILHLYAYRGGGIPAFVPPGHGLLFLTALRLRPHRRTVQAAILATVALAVTHPDVAGVAAASGLVAVLARSRRAPLYAVMVLLVDALELYGTAVGTWAWAHPLANPPAGVALGYVAFDALALAVIRRTTRRAKAPCTWPKQTSFALMTPATTTPGASSTARSIAAPA